MDVILMGIVFFAQFICCITIRHRIWKYAPTLILAGLMSLLVLNANMTEPDPRGMALLAVLILASCFGAMVHMSITLISNRMKNRK